MISLADHNPELLKEWDYEKNNELGLTPETTSYGSAKKVWWKCDKGHEWNAPIDRRTISKAGCPFCSNQKLLKSFNDLESKYPEIAKEFNIYKNKRLPSEYLYGSTNKVWWICSNCGNRWLTEIKVRTSQKSKCPKCHHK